MADWREDITRAELAQRSREFRQRQWEHSPQYIDQLNRERSAMNIREQAWQQRLGLPTQAEQYGEQQRQTLREKAQLDAQMFEKRYTAKDKANITKLRNQQRQAYGMLQNGEITPDEFDKVSKLLKSKELGIVPGELPSLSPYPKGQNVGEFWDQDGITLSRKADGETWQVDERKTARGLAKEQELKAVEKKAELDAKREEAKEKYRLELIKMQVPDTDPKNLSGTRSLTPDEMRERYEKAYPSTPMPAPEEVQQAREYINLMIDRWGNEPPPEVQQGMKEAGALIEASKKRAW